MRETKINVTDGMATYKELGNRGIEADADDNAVYVSARDAHRARALLAIAGLIDEEAQASLISDAGGDDGVPVPHNVEFLVNFYSITREQAQCALDVYAGKYPERLAEIASGLKRQPVIADVVYSCEGMYHEIVPGGWGQPIGDALEQEECWNPSCGATFAPTREGQHLCPDCEEQEYDYHHRREDGALPVGAVGSC